MQEAREWLESARFAVDGRDHDDPFPTEFVQTAALMAIAHALVGANRPVTVAQVPPTFVVKVPPTYPRTGI